MTIFAVVHEAHDQLWAIFAIIIFIIMKRILLYTLFLLGFTAFINADEFEDSINYYVQRISNDYESENYKDACLCFSSILRIYKDYNSDISEDTDYASFENAYASLCYQTGNYHEAIRLGTEALEIRKKVLGVNDPDYAITLGNLALFYSELDDKSEAIRLGTEALEIKKNLLGANHPDYATALDNLAYCFSEIGNNLEAIRLGSEALEIYKKVLGEDHPDYAISLHNLASYYSELYNYSEAIRLETEALDLRESILGYNHPDYLESLEVLASYYFFFGDFGKAVLLESKALEARKTKSGVDNPDYARSLSMLALYQSYLNNDEEAIVLESESLDIRKRIYGESHLQYAKSLGNLASYYSYLGDHGNAIRCGTEALELTKSVQGVNHPSYTEALDDLALIYFKSGDYSTAIQLEKEALGIKKTLDAKELSYANSLGNLALFYFYNGDANEATRIGIETLDIRKKILGTNHIDYAKALGNLASYYLKRGDFKIAIPLLNECMPIVRNNIFRAFSGITTNERFSYWKIYDDEFNSIIPKVIIHSNVEDGTSLLYDNSALFAKGLLLSTEIEMTKLIHESGDTEAIQMYSDLYQNKQMLSMQYSIPIAERSIDCDSLEKVSTELERQLVSRVKEFGDYTRNLSITWRDVQSKLNDNDIAIEFLSYPKNDSTTVYVALTLCKNDTIPILTPLFDEQQLLNASGENESYQTPEADEMIWSPLSSRIEGKTKVYFSASGMLHNIGIEYLSSMEGKECYRLSSTRELAIARSETTSNGAVVYGGIQYDSDVSQMGTPRLDWSYLAHRGFNPDLVTQRGNWDYLTGSLEEANEVDSILEIKNIDVKKVTGLDATETSFKDLSGQRKRILHIATHGFYYNDSTAHCYNERERLGFLQLDNDRPRYIEDKAMTRSGLLFAGAQNTFDGVKIPDGVDDGVLTAQEVAQLDLRGLDLLVLSACQTGLGEITSDGVFGLQRGFKKAGAQSILMSLWKVDDNAAHLLMTEFYRGWMSGMSKYVALRQAQAIVREKYPDPKYWAAFILLDALD